LDLLLYRRQLDQALAKLSAAFGEARNLPPIFRTILPAIIGSLHSAKGDLTTARPLFQQTQRELRALREQSDIGLLPDAADALVEVAARLGERQEMEREADALLRSAVKDAWRFPQSQEVIARSYAILGDAERAVPLLERLLKTPYSFSITLAKLRLDPVWDPIRHDPRFQKLISGTMP
jgi:ATP/maltotriose-dependent transcriptional regulator MalT